MTKDRWNLKKTLQTIVVAATIGSCVSSSALADGYCDPAVANLQVGSAQAAIERSSKLDTSDVGFSTLGGKGVQAEFDSGEQRGHFASMSCLDKLMNKGLDVFFRPPSIDDLIGEISDFVCDQAQAVYAQMTSPISSSVYQTSNLGGFFPGLNLGNLGGGINASVRPGMNNAVSLYGDSDWVTPQSVRPTGIGTLLSK